MDASQVINIGALLVALIAVISSSILTARTIKVNANANHLLTIVDLLSLHRSPDFVKKEKWLWEHSVEMDEDLGFIDQPEPISGAVIEVGYYYQALGYVSEYGIVDRNILLLQTQYRAVRSWDALQAVVRAERELRGGPQASFLNSFERLAHDARLLDVESATRKLSERTRFRFM